jgi:hypothetical protein
VRGRAPANYKSLGITAKIQHFPLPYVRLLFIEDLQPGQWPLLGCLQYEGGNIIAAMLIRVTTALLLHASVHPVD